jgi:hypothetical protein
MEILTLILLYKISFFIVHLTAIICMLNIISSEGLPSFFIS